MTVKKQLTKEESLALKEKKEKVFQQLAKDFDKAEQKLKQHFINYLKSKQ